LITTDYLGNLVRLKSKLLLDLRRERGLPLHFAPARSQHRGPLPLDHGPYDYSGAAFYDPAWDDDALLAARTYVDAVTARLNAHGLSAGGEAHMAPDVAGAIVDAVDQANADLIIMSTHALTGPARALLGSVADAVVRSSPSPVLLVKRSHAKDARSTTHFTESRSG
jgi:nucleotide-binding universal stress UspA family protein